MDREGEEGREEGREEGKEEGGFFTRGLLHVLITFESLELSWWNFVTFPKFYLESF